MNDAGRTLLCIILAGGRSTIAERQADGSNRVTPKMLVRFRGVPLLHHVIDRALETLRRGDAHIGTVEVVLLDNDTGRDIERSITVTARFARALDDDTLRVRRLSQHLARGTAAAVRESMRKSPKSVERVLVLFGYVPLVSAEDLRRLEQRCHGLRKGGAVLGVTRDDLSGYGRVVVEPESATGGNVARLASRKQLEGGSPPSTIDHGDAVAIGGAFCFCRDSLEAALDRVLATDAGADLESIGEVLAAMDQALTLEVTEDELGTTALHTLASVRRLERMTANLEMSSYLQTVFTVRATQDAQREIRKRLQLEPERYYQENGCEAFVINRSHDDSLGGDFYSVLAANESQTAIFFGDVSGHGIEAAHGMLAILAAYRTIASGSGADSHTALELAELCLKLGLVATALFLRVISPLRDGDPPLVSVLSYGHPSVYLTDGSGEVREAPQAAWARTTSLGWASPTQFVAPEIHTLRPGDMICAVTDGVLECGRPSEGEIFGEARLRDTFSRAVSATRDVAAVAQAIEQELNSYAEDVHIDDRSILVFKALDGRRKRGVSGQCG